MSLDELDMILNKDAIIATFPVEYLSSNPAQVEQIYHTHARTHIALGDTDKYLDTIFKWVGGQNKGAFVGAVLGDYGHGKTSFQVHVWDRSRERKILCVPPFKWEKMSSLVDGVAAWTRYVLNATHADLSKKSTKLYERFREKSLKELAEQIARDKGSKVDDVLDTLKAAEASGSPVDTQLTAERFLDYLAEVTDIAKLAGYSGVLVMLDEPEVTAKRLGQARTFQILFGIADGLIARQGDYGVFVSMPENFYASAQATLASLPARLQARNCFPRLRDLYGQDFATTLWERYVQEFKIAREGRKVVSPKTLQAIGQVSSSDRKDLSYGPRTVISAFRRMVHCYRETGRQYSPIDFVQDCLATEIMVSDYGTRIRGILDSPEAKTADATVLMTLAAFPNGIALDTAVELGIDKELKKLCQQPTLVYKRGTLFGLTGLQKAEVAGGRDELQDILVDILGEFAPSPATFDVAFKTLTELVMPKIFEPRKGQQLLGWDMANEWETLGSQTMTAFLTGSFRQTERDYPRRTVKLAVGPIEADINEIIADTPFEEAIPDIVVHFGIRWTSDEPMPQQHAIVSPGDPTKKDPGIFQLLVDYSDSLPSSTNLEAMVGREALTPLELLFVIGEKSKRTLSREYEAQWSAIQESVLTDLVARMLRDSTARTQASEQIGQVISGDALALPGAACRFIFMKRYPHYSTLIRQPHWEKKVDEYIGVLHDPTVPLSCKRGREPWSAPGDQVARVFKTSLMNLTGGSFAGLENLLEIKSGGRQANIEVNLKLHPLEESVRNRITSNNPNPKKKFEGIECWWMPLDELKDEILSSGYLAEELAKIVLIGKSRGSFEVDQYKGQPVLYCKPLDLGQMKVQLHEKLAELRNEISEFQKLPDFKSKMDCDALAREIDRLKDEGQYDKLVTRMNGEFELMHSRLPNYFERWAESVRDVQSGVSSIKTATLDSREMAMIKTPPKAVSSWCADLSTYIVANLKALGEKIRNQCSSIQTSADKALVEFGPAKADKPLEKVVLLLRGYDSKHDLQQQIESTRVEAKTLMGYLRDYELWLRLLSRSDEVHISFIELKKEPAHSAKATELVAKLETIWSDISIHLQTRNVTGLGSHRQFYDQLDKLDEERKRYIQSLRSAFDEVKKSANALLQELDLGPDYRCREVFNPDDIQGCYDRLYSETAKHTVTAMSNERRDTELQRQEIVYLRDIMSQVSVDASGPLITELDDCISTLTAIILGIDKDWARQLVDQPQDARDPIRSALKKARDATRSARKLAAKAEVPDLSTLSSSARAMLNTIPTDASINLKQLILEMMKTHRGSGDVLSESLEGLAELFRNRRIQINVERPRK